MRRDEMDVRQLGKRKMISQCCPAYRAQMNPD
jgi:hypothetical protein